MNWRRVTILNEDFVDFGDILGEEFEHDEVLGLEIAVDNGSSEQTAKVFDHTEARVQAWAVIECLTDDGSDTTFEMIFDSRVQYIVIVVEFGYRQIEHIVLDLDKSRHTSLELCEDLNQVRVQDLSFAVTDFDLLNLVEFNQRIKQVCKLGDTGVEGVEPRESDRGIKVPRVGRFERLVLAESEAFAEKVEHLDGRFDLFVGFVRFATKEFAGLDVLMRLSDDFVGDGREHQSQSSSRPVVLGFLTDQVDSVEDVRDNLFEFEVIVRVAELLDVSAEAVQELANLL